MTVQHKPGSGSVRWLSGSTGNWALFGVVTLVSLATAYQFFPYARDYVRKSAATKEQQRQIQEAETIAYVYDRRVGWKLNGNTQIHRANPEVGYDTRVRTNSEGFIDRDHYLHSPFYRIAIVGDSFVEAEQVPETSRFTNLIEDMVPNMSERKLAVEVMNFGVSNYGAAHAYGVIKHFILKYQPKEVWTFLNGGNDLTYSFPLETPAPRGPYYLYSDRDSKQITDILFGFPKPPEILRNEISERYAELRKTYQNFGTEVLPYFYSDAHHPAMDAVLRINSQCFELIDRTLKAQGIQLRVVYLPSSVEINPALWSQFQEAARRNGVAATLSNDKGERTIEHLLQPLEIPFISLRAALLTASANHEVFRDHLSPYGHRDVAEALSGIILKEGKALSPGPDASASDSPALERHEK